MQFLFGNYITVIAIFLFLHLQFSCNDRLNYIYPTIWESPSVLRNTYIFSHQKISYDMLSHVSWVIEPCPYYLILMKSSFTMYPVISPIDILFRQITTFIKVCMAFVFGLQTLNWKILVKSINWRVWSPKSKATQTFMNVVIWREKVYLIYIHSFLCEVSDICIITLLSLHAVLRGSFLTFYARPLAVQ